MNRITACIIVLAQVALCAWGATGWRRAYAAEAAIARAEYAKKVFDAKVERYSQTVMKDNPYAWCYQFEEGP